MAAKKWHKERLAEDFRREISYVISNELGDSRVPALTTVNDIWLAPDMCNATVMVSVYGDEKERKGALIALNRAAPFIQKKVAMRINHCRNFPRMCFKLDSSIDHSERVNVILNEIKDDLV